ncbi:MAG: hypothetical protein AAGJ82_06750 [Bacteroidota bacterium]
MRFSIIVLLLLCSTGFLSAQITNVNKVKFGKISSAEIELENYPLQPDAPAVVLYDKGVLSMEVNAEQTGFQYVLERHLRIKVFKENAIQYGDFLILLEQSTRSNSREEVFGIKGMTYNLEDGEVVETKLDKEGIFMDRYNESLFRCNIAMPQVKMGSLIELKYTIKSDYTFNLPRWYFQKEIPTDYSFYEATIPEYFNYRLDMAGYASQHLTENVTNETGSGSATFSYRTSGSPSTSYTGGGSQRRTSTINFSTKKYRWVAQEVPGLVREPFAPETDDYLFHVDFELASTNFPGGGRSFSQSWEDVSTLYRDMTSVEQYLSPNREVKAWANRKTNAPATPLETVIQLYEAVQDQLKWSGYYGSLPDVRANKILSSDKANSAAINMLLLSALRAKDIPAYILLSSTRKNGYLSVTRPSISQFNQVLVFVDLPSGKQLILDASQTAVPATLLPTADLNDRGRLITSEGSQWVPLKAQAAQKTATQLQMTLDVDGQLKGELKYKVEDYAGLNLRLAAREETGIATAAETTTGLAMTAVSCENFADNYQRMLISATVDADDQVVDGGELLYVQGVLSKWKAENPLKSEERLMPVDFVTPTERVYVMRLALADGLAIEELPESINFSLPEGKGRYSLRFVDMNGGVQVVEKLTFKEAFFVREEYEALRQFIDLVLENEEATLVIRKS